MFLFEKKRETNTIKDEKVFNLGCYLTYPGDVIDDDDNLISGRKVI